MTNSRLSDLGISKDQSEQVAEIGFTEQSG